MSIAALRRATRDVMAANDLGGLDAGEVLDNHMARGVYHRYAKLLHPDRYPADLDATLRENATVAYRQLTHLYDTFRRPSTAPTTTTTITTKRATHVIDKTTMLPGDLATTFRAQTMRTTDTASIASFIKVAHTRRDNDLLAAEASVLTRFSESSKISEYREFVPRLLDRFAVDNGSGACQANALQLLDDFVSFEQVRRLYPSGVPALDAVWMWRRLLVALGYAHHHEVIHGAVLPQHVMIHPALHGLVLVDWCYASQYNAPLTALVGSRREWYPAEVLAKEPPTPATDIAMAARTMIWLMSGNPATAQLPDCVPRPLRAFFRGCLAPTVAMRPQNVWLLLQEFDELLESMGSPYYPRRFRPFALPTGTHT